MASVLVHTEDESVTLPPQALKRLLERGAGNGPGLKRQSPSCGNWA